MTKIDIPRSANYDANRVRPTRGDTADNLRCFICGKGVKLSTHTWWVLTDESIGWLIPANDSTVPNGGFFAIGPDCAKSIPIEYKARD